MLRTALLTASSLFLTATAAMAEGGQATPPPPPVVVEPDRCPDAFDCAYVGIEYGLVSGDWMENGPTVALGLPMDDGDALGVFAGYNWQNGNLVYGGEVRYLRFNDYTAIPAPAFEIENVLDLRGRLGFATGRAMFYGALGYSIGEGTAPGGPFDLDGFNYGVGAEFNVTESLFLGVDYTARDMEGDQGIFTYEGDVDTLTLRAGFRF